MKSIIALIAVIAIGCSAQRVIEHDSYSDSAFLDFRGFSKDDFLITPYEYAGDYQSIGIIRMSIYPEVAGVNSQKEGYRQVQVGDTVKVEYYDKQTSIEGYSIQKTINGDEYKIGNLKINEAIAEIYEAAKEYGADALTNFKVILDSKTNGQITEIFYNLSGFAIKRTK